MLSRKALGTALVKFRRRHILAFEEICPRTVCLARTYNCVNISTAGRRYGFTRRRSDYWDQKDIDSLPQHLRPHSDETLDLILRQKVYLLQARRGYRVNTDAHILAYFASTAYRKLPGARTRRPLRVLDLGSGVGLVSMLFAKAHNPCLLTLIENQTQLVHRARRNLELNDINGNVLQHDLKNGTLPSSVQGVFDVVLMNPPFYALNGNRKPPTNREKFLSHMETSASFSHFISAASAACDPQNHDAFVAVIHDVQELTRIRKAIIAAQISAQPTLDNGTNPPEPKPTTAIRKQIILHPGGTNYKAYNPDIERFFEDLPRSKLSIGRIKQY
ncbi:unnamed protein product [Agarophyton chilense]